MLHLDSATLADIWHQVFEEHFVYGHLPYVLFVISMLMRDIKWLRIIAIVAGLLRIYIRAYIVYDPVTVLWESTLVLVNIGQLALIWWDSRHRRLSEDEKVFVAVALPGLARRTALRLLRTGTWTDIAEGEVLTTAGQPAPRLYYIAEGIARVEQAGRVVAHCGRGDFIGEMSFAAGGPATATVIADQQLRVIAFEVEALRTLLRRDHVLRLALETGFGRNLVGKLTRTTGVASSA